jgi:hypothetical protein
MNWIKLVRAGPQYNIPRDGTIFLTFFKGRVCMAQFDEEEGRFYIICDPTDSQCWRLNQEREHKFTHWMPLPAAPKDED